MRTSELRCEPSDSSTLHSEVFLMSSPNLVTNVCQYT
jgi:hypothetical protein